MFRQVVSPPQSSSIVVPLPATSTGSTYTCACVTKYPRTHHEGSRWRGFVTKFVLSVRMYECAYLCCGCAGVRLRAFTRWHGCACGCACGLMYPYRCVQINVACFVVLEDACCSHRFRYASRREPTLHLQCARRQRKSERCHECSKSRAYLGKSSAASTATREAHWICVGGGGGTNRNSALCHTIVEPSRGTYFAKRLVYLIYIGTVWNKDGR